MCSKVANFSTSFRHDVMVQFSAPKATKTIATEKVNDPAAFTEDILLIPILELLLQNAKEREL